MYWHFALVDSGTVQSLSYKWTLLYSSAGFNVLFGCSEYINLLSKCSKTKMQNKKW